MIPPPPSSLPVRKLERRHTGGMRKRAKLLTGEGEKRSGRSQIIKKVREPGSL
jgi:hypothetical protein